MKKIHIYDNEGMSFDRYTVWIENEKDADCYTMSNNPSAPNGVNMYSHTVETFRPYLNHGKNIRLIDVPKQVQKAINERIKE